MDCQASVVSMFSFSAVLYSAMTCPSVYINTFEEQIGHRTPHASSVLINEIESAVLD